MTSVSSVPENIDKTRTFLVQTHKRIFVHHKVFINLTHRLIKVHQIKVLGESARAALLGRGRRYVRYTSRYIFL